MTKDKRARRNGNSGYKSVFAAAVIGSSTITTLESLALTWGADQRDRRVGNHSGTRLARGLG